MKLLSTLLVLLISTAICSAQEFSRFAVARQPTPVFSTPQAAHPDAAIKRDRCGQVRELEFIALPGAAFKVEAVIPGKPTILQVSTNDYQAPAGTRLHVAADTLTLQATEPPARKPPVPELLQTLQNLRTATGLPYVWGGNLRNGVARNGLRQFAGLDCSGLLYEATNGYTPRNTEQLVSFGSAVPIKGLAVEALLRQLRPLDLIVWKGHVLIVLDQETVIESILPCNGEKEGVLLSPLKQRLVQIMRQRTPIDHWPADRKQAAAFVVRRWL